MCGVVCVGVQCVCVWSYVWCSVWCVVRWSSVVVCSVVCGVVSVGVQCVCVWCRGSVGAV